MANNSSYFWNTAFFSGNSNEHKNLKEYDSLDEAFVAALNHDDWGPGVRRIVIYFP